MTLLDELILDFGGTQVEFIISQKTQDEIKGLRKRVIALEEELKETEDYLRGREYCGE